MASFMNRFLIGCASLLVVLAQPALAQFGGGGGFGGMDAPRINREQLSDYADLLGLDETQREVAQLMLDEYIDGVQTAADALREASQEARQEFEETRDRSAFTDLRELSEQTRERMETLESRFMDDLRVLLTPEQEESWVRVERAHRRATTLPRGLMSGERVDLFEIVKGMELDGEYAAEAKAVLAEYEVSLDRVLAARNEKYEQGLEMMRQRDFEALQSHFEDARAASIRVRDTNRSFARRLEAVVPEDKLPELSAAVRRASFPTVYRSNRAERALEATASMDGLSDDQRGRIEAIALATERRMDQVNRKLANQIESNEVNMTMRDMMRGGGRGNEDGTRALFREKRDVVEQTITQIRQVLSEEQAAQLEAAIGGDEEGRGDGPGEGRGRMRGGQRDGGQAQRRQREF